LFLEKHTIFWIVGQNGREKWLCGGAGIIRFAHVNSGVVLMAAFLGLAAPAGVFAQNSAPNANQVDPARLDRQLSELEARMRKSLDSFRVPSEYRQLCAANQQHDRAITFFCDLANAQPGSWRAHLELSCAYVDKIPTCQGVTALISRGALAGKALDQADMVVSQNPGQWVSHYVRGLNHLNWPRAFHHSEEAIKDLARCVEIQEKQGGQAGRPHYLRVHIALGDAFTKAGQYQEGRAAWQRGLGAFPQAGELKARLETKTDPEQLKYVEAQRRLDQPVDTSLAFLDGEK
jgi:tetratricopeptide (TPR) repeat protein